MGVQVAGFVSIIAPKRSDGIAKLSLAKKQL